MLALKLIPTLWIIVVLCNLLTKKIAPEIMGWYPFYAFLVGLATTVFLLHCAS